MNLKFKEKNPVAIALVGIGLILAIIFGAFQVAAMPFIAGTTYEAVFTEAGGLGVGDKVKMAGVEAGTVTEVDLDNGDVVVSFTVQTVTPGNQSVASIGTQTLLGERNLEISSRGPEEMSAGDRIPLERTTSPYSVTEGLEDLTRRVGEIDTPRVGEALDVFADTFQDTPDDLATAMEGVSRISKTIASRDDALRTLLERARGVSGTLSERSQQLTTLLNDGQALLAELQSRRSVIVKLLADTTGVAQQIVALNEEQRSRLEPTLRSLNKTVALLQRNEGNLSASIDRVSKFITGLGEGLEHGTSFTGYAELGGLGAFPTAQFIPALTLPDTDENAPRSYSSSTGGD